MKKEKRQKRTGLAIALGMALLCGGLLCACSTSAGTQGRQLPQIVYSSEAKGSSESAGRTSFESESSGLGESREIVPATLPEATTGPQSGEAESSPEQPETAEAAESTPEQPETTETAESTPRAVVIPITSYARPTARPNPTEGSPRESTAPLPTDVTDYSREENWAYLALGEDKPVDVFFLCPTVIDEGEYLRLEEEVNRRAFIASLEKERGLYEELCCFYAPFYRQMAAEVYKWSQEEQAPCRDRAYRDVAAAFRYYLDRYDLGKPILLAGFSQGSELLLRLMQEFFDPDTPEGQRLTRRLVAVYAIGAGLPETMVAQYPWLKPADGETDTGGIICYDCELPGVTGSVLLPAGSRSMTINPLSWSRDGEPADASLNLGACFLSGREIVSEIPGLCGCYIEPERGALVVTGINPDHFPTEPADVLPEGNLHGYDYQFFYRNIQDNVRKRIEAFLNQN